jgi:hypothetical protein
MQTIIRSQKIKPFSPGKADPFIHGVIHAAVFFTVNYQPFAKRLAVIQNYFNRFILRATVNNHNLIITAGLPAQAFQTLCDNRFGTEGRKDDGKKRGGHLRTNGRKIGEFIQT